MAVHAPSVIARIAVAQAVANFMATVCRARVAAVARAHRSGRRVACARRRPEIINHVSTPLHVIRRKAPGGAFLFLLPLAFASTTHAQTPSVTGQTGLISMPDARVASEGAWRTGLSFLRPYETVWSSVSVFPWAEA